MGQKDVRELIKYLLHKIWKLEDELWTKKQDLKTAEDELLRIYNGR